MAIASAVAGVLAAPATAPAQGGVDPTRFCIQEELNTYLYNPLSVKAADQLADNSANCIQGFAAHMQDPALRQAWRNCVVDGLKRSPPLDPTPFIDALYRCTATWLQFRIQIDPNPN
jgi:hypothetical protein